MKRRGRFIMCCLATTTVAATLVGLSWSDDGVKPPLKSAPLGTDRAELVVGPNVHISKPHETMRFTECIIAADPKRAKRLFASSMYWPHNDGQSLVGYLSDDGGKTWATSLDLLADRAKKERLADQTAVFGPDGDLYFVHMRFLTFGVGRAIIGRQVAGHTLDWHCLPAGAKTWETRGRIDRFIDRPWLAVDGTSSKHRGRLYCTANAGTPYFITSADGGRTFQFPKVPSAPNVTGRAPVPPVVLSDGSLLAAYRGPRNGREPWEPQAFPTFVSTDGGQSLTAGACISDGKYPPWRTSTDATEGFFPQMAVDPGSRRFADHLYVVWAQRFDFHRHSKEWILFCRSTDRGKSWSAPVNLSQQPGAEDAAKDYIAYLPCVAVNKAGVVAVTWYDRRGLPSAAAVLPRGGADGGMKGWNLRMRVSKDGGATWSPSVPVTSKPSTGKLTGGHTAGLAADAAGGFHPAWIDDRTGKPQLWTARVTVK